MRLFRGHLLVTRADRRPATELDGGPDRAVDGSTDHAAPVTPAVPRQRGTGPLSDDQELPCTRDFRDWELEAHGRTHGLYDRWQAARNTCETCPARRSCKARMRAFYPAAGPDAPGRHNPHGVIWAGVAYGDNGQALTERALRRLASVHENQARAATG